LIGENDWQESDTDYDRLKTSEGIGEIAKYADGIGPWWNQLIDNKKQVSDIVGFAKHHKLTIHPFTFRADELPQWADSYQAWLILFIDTVKVDGLFTDFPVQTLQIIKQTNNAKLATKP
jgi:glycerophosphoryl diester phosphodiesterase